MDNSVEAYIIWKKTLYIQRDVRESDNDNIK